MTVSFRGTRYHGWQIQPNDTSVQQTLEEALQKLTGVPTPVTGAGRTDAGVNARVMPAHFDARPMDAAGCQAMARSLNAICRPDIVVRSIVPVKDDAHARFDATKRTYRYFVNTRPDPFIYPLSWFCPTPLDVDAMNLAARDLIGTHDFTSFSKLHTDVKTNICTVIQAEWKLTDDSRMYFEISADRFLRNMVRAIVGTLVEVGRWKYPVTHVAEVMRQQNRGAAGTSMPAHALFLWDVEYPYPITGERDKE